MTADDHIRRELSAAGNDQHEHPARDRQILLEMQQLVVAGEVRVKERRRQQAEQAEAKCCQSRHQPDCNRKPG